MRKLSKVIGADDKLTRYAILNGLRPALASYVTQQKPDTMEALLEAARIAEITCTPSSTTDSQLTEQMASMQCQLQRLVSRYDRCSTSPVAADRRSVSPRPKVTFGRNTSIPTGPYEDNPTPGPARTSTLRGQFRTGRRPTFGGLGRVRTQPPVRFQNCSRCGYEQHTAGANCPAVNKACNYCRKRGHFSRVGLPCEIGRND